MIPFMLISLFVINDVDYISSTGIERLSAGEYVVSGFVGDTVAMPCEVDPYRDYGEGSLVYRLFDILNCGKVSTVTWSKNVPGKVRSKYEDGSHIGDPGAAWNVHLDFENPHRTSLLNNYSPYLELNGVTVKDEGTYVCNVTYVNEHCNSLFVTKLYALNFIDLYKVKKEKPILTDVRDYWPDLEQRQQYYITDFTWMPPHTSDRTDMLFNTFFANGRWRFHFIPYQLDYSFSDSERIAIKSAADEISVRTNLKFTEMECAADYDHVIIRKSSECKTFEGRLGGPQILYLSSACCKERGIIFHLLLHTLGMRHEHQRPDRDEYITVNWDNIMHDHKHLFNKYGPSTSNTLDVAYNYRSVMHFPSSLYAKNKSIPVLLPKYPNVHEFELGEGFTEGYLTKLDVDRINEVYGCDSFDTYRPSSITFTDDHDFRIQKTIYFNSLSCK